MATKLQSNEQLRRIRAHHAAGISAQEELDIARKLAGTPSPTPGAMLADIRAWGRREAIRALPGLRRAVALSAAHSQSGRAPRAAGTRRRGSRRVTGSRSPPSSDDDPGGGEPHDIGRVCGTCGGPCGPSERTCAACRQRRSRARRRARDPSRPIWPESTIIATAMTTEPLPVLAALMQEPPSGRMAVAA